MPEDETTGTSGEGWDEGGEEEEEDPDAGEPGGDEPGELLVVVKLGRVPYKVPIRIPIGAAIGIGSACVRILVIC